jgi:hypothetical protein
MSDVSYSRILNVTPRNGVGEEDDISLLELVESSAFTANEQFATLLAILLEIRVINTSDIETICWDSSKFKYNFLTQGNRYG